MAPWAADGKGSCHALLDREVADASAWRARYEARSGVLEYVGGPTRVAAASHAFVELGVEWTFAHPEVDALPSAQADPIAVAALEALGVRASAPATSRAENPARRRLLTALPIISGRACIRAPERAGYRVTHQKASHVRLRCEGRTPVTVPLHAKPDRGTLRSIFCTAGISTDDLLRLLA